MNSTSIDADFAGLMQQYKLYKFRIKRVETNAGLKSGTTDCTELPKNKISEVTKSHPNIDPSGYIYEAVASNRVEDATVTLYESVNGVKTLVESESDTIVGEKNPLVTDARGHYEWFVPEGLWLVEANKAGYEQADSQNLPNIPQSEKRGVGGVNWLVVPPPQTEVNIGMTSEEAPYLKSIYAASDGVHLEFSRYMDESTLTAGNFALTSENGSAAEFAVELLDSEAAPHTTSTSYTSKVLLKPKEPLSEASAVAVTVAADVASYAGTKMGTAYESVLDVKKAYKLTMEGGTVDGAIEVMLLEGAQVQIVADAAQAGVLFDGWSASAGVLGDAARAVTAFTMPASNVTVKAAFTGQARGVRDASYDNAGASGDQPAPSGSGGDKPAAAVPSTGGDKPAVVVPGSSGDDVNVSQASDPALSSVGKAAVKSLKSGSRKLTVKMAKKAAAYGAKGFQIAYRVKGTSKWRYVTSSSKKRVIKKLARGKRYQVKVRAFKETGAVKYCGAWSAIKLSKKIK